MIIAENVHCAVLDFRQNRRNAGVVGGGGLFCSRHPGILYIVIEKLYLKKKKKNDYKHSDCGLLHSHRTSLKWTFSNFWRGYSGFSSWEFSFWSRKTSEIRGNDWQRTRLHVAPKRKQSAMYRLHEKGSRVKDLQNEKWHIYTHKLTQRKVTLLKLH